MKFNINRLLPYLIFLLPNFYSPLVYEYNILPFVFSIFFLINYFVKRKKTNFLIICLISPIFLFLPISFFFFNLNDFVKDLAFFTLLFTGIIYSTNNDLKRFIDLKFFKIIISIVFSTILIQLLGLSFFLEPFLIRQVNRAFIGFSSIYGEPSFLLIAMLSLSILYSKNSQFFYNKMKKEKIAILGAATMSGSTFLIIFLPFYYNILKRKLLFLFFMIITIFIIFYLFPFALRVINVILIFIKSGLIELLTDGSIGARFSYIHKDLYVASKNIFQPFGIGTYSLVTNEINFSQLFDEDFIYNKNLSGSLFGRFLVEFGIVWILFLIIFIVFCFLNSFWTFFLGSLLIIVSFQMISTFFSPFIFSLGFFIGSILNRKSKI